MIVQKSILVEMSGLRYSELKKWCLQNVCMSCVTTQTTEPILIKHVFWVILWAQEIIKKIYPYFGQIKTTKVCT